jgi:nitrite reductase/ring-hydroxylating ferredoxin subunit
MFGMKLKWYLLFETQAALEDYFAGKNAVVHRSMFGEVLLLKEGDKFYAFKNKCPHQGKPLDACWIDKGSVVCPFHQYHFSLETGRGHGLYLDKYDLRIDEKGVFLGKEVWSLF